MCFEFLHINMAFRELPHNFSIFYSLEPIQIRINIGIYSIPSGRYTRDIEDFKLSVPWKISEENEFKTFKIPHFFEQDLSKRRKRFINGGGDNDLDLNEDMVRYFIGFGEDDGFHAELWPNHGLLAPEAVSEYRDANVPIQDKKLKRLDVDNMCHFSGRIRGVPESKVALSTCDGLAGYIAVGGKRYFIEPVQDHVPNADGQHLHVLYQRHSRESYSGRSQCGTSDNWEDAWRKRFSQQYGGSTVDVKEMLRSTTANVTKRGSESIHRYLETLIVCDKKFLDHHKNIDVETYVLTVMNMVADYYHDSSSGNQMDVVVVRIMYLDKEEEEIDLTIGQNAENTLSSFCKWQKRINPADISSPNHHDIAVLLTRYDICSDNVTNCGLMGLAYVATACTDDQPCAINEDGGLVLGIVVAHEMGHVMGCSHDKEGESPCPPQDKDDSFYVMAPFVHLYTTRWSACSKGFMTSLFENDLGECLNDEPQISIYKDREMLPGVVYDANQQCRMLFPDSKLCPIKDDNFCQELLCQTTPTSCMSNQEPPADGTKCGENMWCYRKKCVEIGERPEAVNGGWGEWGPFSECSRTCGGGVSIASRECDNPRPAHRGRYCIGERKKIKTCNMDPCPVGAPSFREVQCKEHNNKPFKGKLLQWRAYLMAGDTSSTNQDCEKNDGDSQPDKGKISGKIFRFPREINSKLGDKSICSTKKLPSEEEILTTIYKCREQAIETAKNFGIHLEDECEWIIVSLPIVKNIEVDNGLDENEDEDERDDVEPSVEHNSQDNPCVLYCLNNENTFAKLEPRVKDGTRCKPGTKDMCISGVCKKIGCDGQMDSDAVEDVCGICNGDGTRCDVIDKIFKDPPGNGYVKVVTVPAGSRKVVFEEIAPSENTIAVSDTDQSKYFLNGGYGEQLDGEVNFGDFQGIYTHPESQKEKLIINGPLTKDLLLQVAFFKPENVGYRYKYATKSTAATYTPKYHWEQNDWEECSNRCGGGFRTAIYNCIEEKSGKVSDKFCEDQEKPEKMTEACNEQPCKTKWKVGRWGQCHACKYKSGVRIREVECVRESNRYGHDDILVEDSECEGAKPGTRELCNSHKKCKERRFTDGLPDDLMEDVWKQIHVRAARESPDDNWVEHEHREEQQETSTVLDKKNCHSKTDTTDDEPWNSSKDSNESIANDKDLNGNHTNNELSNGYNTNNKDSKGNHTHEMPPNIGKVIKDRVPENEIKLIEVPLKQSPMNMDLSDNAFETVGDQISDSLDTDKARIVKGKAAADVMKKLQHQHEEKENQHHHHDEKERRKESNKVTGSSEKPTK